MKTRIFTLFHQENPPHRTTEVCCPWPVAARIGEHLADVESLAEMRGHFWVWRNLYSSGTADWDYVGFQHYRRHLLFNPCDPFATIKFDKLSPLGEIPEWVYNFDVIAPHKWVMEQGLTVREQFVCAHGAHAMDVLLRLVPEFEKSANEKSYHVCNIFLTRWEIFDRYMNFWWDLMQALMREVPIPDDFYQRRILAFLSERIFSFWLDMHRAEYKVCSVPLATTGI